MAGPQKEQFAAFGIVQFVAAVHIMAYHTWQQTNYLAAWVPRNWGPGWVACFFVLSGFKLTFSQLRKKDPLKIEPFVPYMWKRLMRLLPIYYSSLFITLLLKAWSGNQQPVWINLPSNLTLIYSWIGSVAGGWHAGWHGTHWYMCDLVFHQILWRHTFPWVSKLSGLACACLMVVCVLLMYLRCLLIQWKYAEKETTYWVGYTFNQFMCGMLLAKLYVSRTGGVQGPPRDYLAITIRGRRIPLSSLSIFLLLLTFFYNVDAKWFHYYLVNCVWSGVMLPAYILLVWCIALEEGPLDWLCHRRPFCWMGEVSYGVYLFHWNTLMITRSYGDIFMPESWSAKRRFWVIMVPATVLFSGLAAWLVDRPIQAWSAAYLRRATAAEQVHAKAS